MTGPLPHRVLAFYGDDFTGSSAVMEVLTFAGVPTVMFLDPPDAATLECFGQYRAIGIASTSRARSPEWMDRHLPAAYAALKALGAPVTHYKTCSTFDSSPSLGSIGRAIEHGRAAFEGRTVPLVTGAPAIGRYQMFGNLFAAYGGATHRLDRHPVMARHPATPMDEADLGRHLAAQTDLSTGLVDLVALKAGRGAQAYAAAAKNAEIVSIDVFDEDTLAAAGEIVWAEACRAPIFAAGSQGVEYALIAHWQETGLLAPPPAERTVPAPERMMVVSGSVSPITAAQIACAEAQGFAVVALEAAAAVDEAAWPEAVAAASAAAGAALSAGKVPLVATARGPDDPSVARFRTALQATGADRTAVAERIGAGLGTIVRTLHGTAPLQRVILSGGDTSGYAVTELGVYALSAEAPLAPGAPLCRTFAEDAAFDGLELCMKGGQMGADDFFVASTGRTHANM